MSAENKSLKNYIPAISITIGLITAIYGVVVIIAWQNNISFLKTFGLGAVPIKANAGACFLLSGIALILLQLSHSLTRIISRLLAIIVITIGFLSIVEIVFSVNLGIDEILFRKLFLTGTVAGPTRMALNGSICMILLGILLLFLSLKNLRFTYLVEFILVLAVSINLIGLLGFIFGLARFSATTGYSNMAVVGALVYLLVCSGVIFTIYSKIHLIIEIDKSIFAGLIFIATLLIFVSLLSNNGYKSIYLTSERSDHSQMIKNYLNLLLFDILDVETGVRGYLISNDEDYFKSISTAKEELAVSMHQLTDLLRGNKEQELQLDTLNQMVLDRVEQTEMLMFVIESEGKNAGIDFFNTRKSKLLTDKIRFLITNMINYENKLLKIRNENEVENSAKAQTIISLNLIIEFFLLVLIFIVIRKNISQKNKAILEFRKLNEELEIKVKERTLTLTESEEKFRSLFKKSPFAIAYHEMIFDDSGKPMDYRFLEVNEAFIRMIGIDPTGKKVTEAFPGIENSSFDWIGTYGHVAITGEQIRFEQFFDSTNRLYDCVAFRSEKDQYAVIFLDITERRMAEEEINRLNERILTATQSAQLGIWDWDVLNNHLEWDDQMYKLYGINKESFSGAYEAWLNGLHPDDREFSEKESGNALTGDKDYDTEFRVIWPDGSVHFLKTKGKVFRDENGKPERMTGINYDITAQKHAEEEINNLTIDLEKRVADRTSQLEAANKELESFSYSVSHDLKAPLRHINGFVDILTKEYCHLLPEEARHYLQTIAGASQTMGTLISDLLSFSKAGRVEMKKTQVCMGRIVDEVISLYRTSLADRKIEWEISPLPDVNGDINLLHNVWVNLIDNAVKYTRFRENTLIRIGFEEKNNEIVFFISDNGVGFDMKYAIKLFGVFQRLHSSTQFEGSGIGLANVQRIIFRHGGRTWADAERDKGASFYFSLPK